MQYKNNLTKACPHDAISRRNALHFRESQRSMHAVCAQRIAENQGVTAEIVVMRTRPKTLIQHLLLGAVVCTPLLCSANLPQNQDKETLSMTLESTSLHQAELRTALHRELKQNFLSILCHRARACHADERTFQENAYRRLVLEALSDEMRDGELKAYALQKMLWQHAAPQREPTIIRETLSRSFAALRGKLPWPILSHFQPKTLSRQGQGIIIPAMGGALVRAIHPGKVVFADELRGYGQLLIVEHDDAFMTLYGHNRQLNKKVGDLVTRGEAIAEVGEATHDTGLYFEIRENGTAVDPTRFCQKEALFP